MQNDRDISRVILEIQRWLLRKTASGAVRRMHSLRAAIGTDVGNVRSENQDRAMCVRSRDARGRGYLLVAVSDGIGGMRDGASCAALTLATFAAAVTEAVKRTNSLKDWLNFGCQLANVAVNARFNGKGGATLVAVALSEAGGCYWLSVGDSRVYQASAKGITQLSKDDTLAGQLGDRAEDSDDRRQLLQYIGIGEGIVPHVEQIDTSKGGSILLTTDGVHYLQTARSWFQLVIENALDEFQITRRLIELSKWCGGPDNASAICLSIGGPSLKEAFDEATANLEIYDPFGDILILTPDLIPDINANQSKSATSITPGDKVEQGSSPEKRGNFAKKNKKNRKSKSATKLHLEQGDLDEDSVAGGVQIDFIPKDGDVE